MGLYASTVPPLQTVGRCRLALLYILTLVNFTSHARSLLLEVAGKDDSTFFSESTSLMETKKSNIRIQKMH
jgi:hypothetical protein